MAPWSSIETIIIVFFASRNVSHAACAELLKRRVPDSEHTTIGIRSKLTHLRVQRASQLYNLTKKSWTGEDVDALKSEMSAEDLEKAQLRFDEADREIIKKYRNSKNVQMEEEGFEKF
ncbi:MAG: hypothetical protein M1834_008502 [Cirrosporium novae-zelandiae]|nr:MAG: hypothetical protein M1834_008502 [Cirrosporium novae-zelandiae]